MTIARGLKIFRDERITSEGFPCFPFQLAVTELYDILIFNRVVERALVSSTLRKTRANLLKKQIAALPPTGKSRSI